LPPDSPAVHPVLTFWLDVADKLIKFAAVALGGVWTYWNYRKSRTYAQKLELTVSGAAFERQGLCVEITASIKNLGSSQHLLDPDGSTCEVVAIFADSTEEAVTAFPVFTLHDYIEPSETIGDQAAWRSQLTSAQVLWFKVNLRIVSGKVEWNESHLIRVNDLTAQPRQKSAESE